ncbi:MAG: hypothetical protein COX77_03920 [Candidatus Komeilibacteria bacterium CG_4_10_14_0_2_um_filter_37_10]|uniref:Glycosyltransferase 2-like domain-containing protein n=1 Tax=Candidatus Komeilibacteria bacterium CG_4_10_14_0_2_um_filter_37_10 TaxID=1974470 RepID=A0A2M7VDV7_9BACT|nr:MAG: hypothetical protein COX77_03920 [Candidatus Komeilibacteria bacterium CG_4_10_14_0_2_um_filter_37_10]
MIKNSKKLSIIVVTRNADNYLYDCLNSVFAQDLENTEFDLLIIDNCSNDDTIRIIQENYPQIKFIQLKNNVGFSKAYNLGIAWTKGEYILCLNQDVVLDKEYCSTLIEYLNQNVTTAAVTGKILRYDFLQHQTVNTIDTLGIQVKHNHQFIDFAQGQNNISDYNQVVEIFGVSAAVAIYRRVALDQVKINYTGYQAEYFDEDFFAYKEDIDLAYRLRLNNWQSFMIPNAIAYHARANRGVVGLTDHQIGRLAYKKNHYLNYLSYRNHLAVLLKNEFLVNLIIDSPQIIWYELKKILFMSLTNKYFWLKLLLAIKFYRRIWKKRKLVKKMIKVNYTNIRQWYV